MGGVGSAIRIRTSESLREPRRTGYAFGVRILLIRTRVDLSQFLRSSFLSISEIFKSTIKRSKFNTN